ncbi:hypothetical protein FoTM2_017712 [Fusarium oxysporum f. sp. vasinfectum]|nr:hypothetical protein FoTM2_017712 [Fusarium oxysporum f. sp. vasinfectum]
MEFESNYWVNMGDSFSLCSQPMPCLSTTTSFSAASSAYDPFTPTSTRSTPNESRNMEFGSPHNFVSHRAELAPPSSAMGKSMFGPVKPESEHILFSDSLPNTPMKREQLNFEYEHMMDMNMAHHESMGSLRSSNSFGMYSFSSDDSMGPASFMMTPTQSISGSEAAETGSSWLSANDSPNSFFPNRQLSSDFEAFDLDRHPQSPLYYHLHDPNSPNHMRAQRKLMMHEIQQKSAELKRAQIRSSRKRSIKPDSAQFCGKDQFNRQDNLNNHRKLHARPNSRNRGVEFIPAAVPVIEQEERSRKRRAPSKSKIAEKRGSGD